MQVCVGASRHLSGNYLGPGLVQVPDWKTDLSSCRIYQGTAEFFSAMYYNGPAVKFVADCVEVGMGFCIVQIDEQELGVTIKLSR